jgi:hypothetical protein
VAEGVGFFRDEAMEMVVYRPSMPSCAKPPCLNRITAAQGALAVEPRLG